MRRAFATVAKFTCLAALGLATAPRVSGQTALVTSGARLIVDALGPKVGERIPAFALKDQNGVEWTRESIMGPKGAMLVFFRSADW